jgi:hypothetical protein
MTISKIGGGDGVSVAVGVERAAGVVATRDGRVTIRVGEESTVDEACGAHAVKRTRVERKIRDFIFVLLRSMVE